MHKIFVSEGIVLQKRGVGEANTLVALFTQELGLIRASARSARFEKSKLRYGLEMLTTGRFSLVRGRYEWKLTGIENSARNLMHTQRRASLARIAKLLLRLIHGEEPVPELYLLVTDGLAYLSRAVSQKDADSIECVLVLRILASLGYLPQTAELAPFIEKDFFSMELSAEVERSRTLLIRTINESLFATGL
jgi:DNA repair protein RecO